MSDTESDSGSVAEGCNPLRGELASAPAAMPIAPPTIKVKKAKAAAAEHPVLEQFKELSAEEQANLLKHMSLAHEKTLKQALKDASKTKKTKKAKDPDAPKRPQSEANKAWIAYVKAVAAETGMKYGDAMKEASSRREAGDPAAPPKAAAKPAKAPKAAAAPAAPAAPSKEDKKAAKKAAKTAAPAAPAAPKAAKKTVAPVPAPAATAPSKEEKKAAKKAAKAAAAPPPPPPAEETEDSDQLSAWTHKGEAYYRSSRNELWKQNADNTLGDWVGVYNPMTDKIDTSAPEPALEE